MRIVFHKPMEIICNDNINITAIEAMEKANNAIINRVINDMKRDAFISFIRMVITPKQYKELKEEICVLKFRLQFDAYNNDDLNKYGVK